MAWRLLKVTTYRNCDKLAQTRKLQPVARQFHFILVVFENKGRTRRDKLPRYEEQNAAAITEWRLGKVLTVMCYICEVWHFWVSLFPSNEIFGTRTNTAIFAMILLFALAGWMIGCILGKDPGVR
jgi:magnesium-transporting ATPase (P-type)